MKTQLYTLRQEVKFLDRKIQIAKSWMPKEEASVALKRYIDKRDVVISTINNIQ